MLILYTMAEAVVAPTTMKTIICSAHGASKDVLQLKSDVSIPTIEKPTYVLVKILYASLNAVDYKEVTGQLGPVTSKKPPFVTGIVFAGRVIAKGTDVCLKDRLEIGDLVYGQCWNSTHGSFAEYCVVDGSKVHRMPTIDTFTSSIHSIDCTNIITSHTQDGTQTDRQIIDFRWFHCMWIDGSEVIAQKNLCLSLGADQSKHNSVWYLRH
eukprot:204817_1